MNVQIQNSLRAPHHDSFKVTLRQSMRSRIYAILQHKYGRPDAVSQQKLMSLAKSLETKLLSLAKSEEEYSDLRDLEFRIAFLLKELQRRNSLRVACPPSSVEMSSSDRISALPDCLLTQILLNLSTKDSVKTSVLSQRWRKVYLDVPGIEVNSNDCRYFFIDDIKNFIDKFLESKRELNMQKFKIKHGESNVYFTEMNKWIATVINRGAQYLDVDTLGFPLTIMPLDIYKSKTLVSLKLVFVAMANPKFVISLPCLKIMHLEDIWCSDDLIMEKLISGCSVLEDLTVCRNIRDKVPVLRVRSLSLKRFYVRFGFEWRMYGKEYAVEIDSPGLKYMNFRDDQSVRVIAKNMSSLFLIDIDTKFNCAWYLTNLEMKKGIVQNFLTGISSVRQMIISQRSLEVIYLHLGQIVKFHNLSRLEASFCTLLLQALPDVLESCPILKHLTLSLVYLKELEPENLELTNVPQCLLSSLEFVEIREVITGVERPNNKRSMTKVAKHKRKVWMQAVKYIFENAVVLKKLVLCFSPETNKVSHISEELLTFTKRSPSCEVFIKMALH